MGACAKIKCRAIAVSVVLPSWEMAVSCIVVCHRSIAVKDMYVFCGFNSMLRQFVCLGEGVALKTCLRRGPARTLGNLGALQSWRKLVKCGAA